MFNAKLYRVFLLLFCSMHTHAQWHNWAGNQRCNPKLILNPTTKDELIDIVKKISLEGSKIGIVGAGHSFSAIACTDDCCLSMKNCNKIISIDPHLMQVRAEGGMLLKDFNTHIAAYGLALPNLPAMGDMTLAGALSTATHGTGNSGTLSSFITHIELITADGRVHNLSAKHNPEEFKAACVNLGTLGIVYSVAMQCEPLFMLEYHENKMSLDAVLSQYKQLLEQSDYFQFRWQLADDTVYTDHWNRVSMSGASTVSDMNKKVSYEALQWDKNTEVGMASEIAIPIDVLPEAVALITALAARWVSKGWVISEVVCRFVKADTNSYLSPAAYREVVYLNIGTDIEDGYYDFLKDFEQTMYSLGGRPHWGKVNFLNHEKVCTLYEENLIQFMVVKNRLDPHNTFLMRIPIVCLGLLVYYKPIGLLT